MILNKNEAVLLLGTNLGDRVAFFEKTKLRVLELIGPIIEESNIYESASWGYQSDNNFLNQVLVVYCELSAQDLLAKTQKIESELGKSSNSTPSYSDRPIDIDILFYENQIVNLDNLSIPHPHIQDRRFTLVPLCDILPDLIHPVLKTTMLNLKNHCKDNIEPYLFVQ